MKFVLFCEGYTEKEVLPDLLSRWLNPRLNQRVGFKTVRFDGWKELVADTPKKARMHLAGSDILGVISILDLYGPDFYPVHAQTAKERQEWGTQHMQSKVDDSRYRHHFAIHEVEAWILSQPELFPQKVRDRLPARAAQPETVNFDEPPAKLLQKIYSECLRKNYKKVVDGKKLFSQLDPEIAFKKCPDFSALVNDLLDLCPEDFRNTENC